MSEHYVTSMTVTVGTEYVLMACRCGLILDAGAGAAISTFAKHVKKAQEAEPKAVPLHSWEQMQDALKSVGIDLGKPPFTTKEP